MGQYAEVRGSRGASLEGNGSVMQLPLGGMLCTQHYSKAQETSWAGFPGCAWATRRAESHHLFGQVAGHWRERFAKKFIYSFSDEESSKAMPKAGVGEKKVFF